MRRVVKGGGWDEKFRRFDLMGPRRSKTSGLVIKGVTKPKTVISHRQKYTSQFETQKNSPVWIGAKRLSAPACSSDRCCIFEISCFALSTQTKKQNNCTMIK